MTDISRASDEELAGLAAREVARRDGLLAGVEVDRVAAVGVEVAEERALPAREREEGHRGGDADVHADHADLDVVPVAADGRARLGEDRRAVAVRRGVHDVDRLVERGGVDDRQHRAEDLLAGDVHVGRDAVEDRRADERAVRVGVGAAAVDRQRRAGLDSALDPFEDAVAGGRRDDRPDVGPAARGRRRPRAPWCGRRARRRAAAWRRRRRRRPTRPCSAGRRRRTPSR